MNKKPIPKKFYIKELDMTIETDGTGGGSISGNNQGITLKEWRKAGLGTKKEFDEYHAAWDGVESLLLALACEGVNLNAPQFGRAIKTATDAIGNNI